MRLRRHRCLAAVALYRQVAFGSRWSVCWNSGGLHQRKDFNKIDAYNYFDLTTRFDLMENVTFTLTVQNLFDKKPPVVGSDSGPLAFNSGNTFPSTYDAIGRRFGAAVKLRF